MRLQIKKISLTGTTREVEFRPGLNIITGPIASGKTTLIRMCHGLFGSSLENYPPEARDNVVALGGQILIGNSDFLVVRPFTSTRTAKVDISGLKDNLRLPALQLDATASYTYGQWLLRILGLPEIRVPSAPTRPDSEPTSLSINDFFLYCVLSQEGIDNSICGHRDTYKNIKRKYVFEVLYGIYNTEAFRLQERLHDVHTQIVQLDSQAANFDRILADTPWENRAALQEQLGAAQKDLEAIENVAVETKNNIVSPPETQILRGKLLKLDEKLSKLQSELEHEQSTIVDLKRLIRQLETQSKRLTKTIIARKYLTDFEFIICPRCGAAIGENRGSEDICNLCLQNPNPQLDRKDFVTEQDRVAAQIVETRELVESHTHSVNILERHINELSRDRANLGHDLDFKLSTYVSDSASKIAIDASKRPAVVAMIERLKDYLRLYDKRDVISLERVRLQSEKDEIEGEIESLSTRQDVAEARIQTLEKYFEESLQRLGVPRFMDPPKASISRSVYLPVLDGRRFDDLSSQGLQVLVNVAHAVAHQLTAIKLELPLPNILLIDGLTKNVGQEGYDAERVKNAYAYLIELSKSLDERLQIIVADGNVPAEAEKYVRLRLSESDRLIPDK